MEKQKMECPKCKEEIFQDATLCRYCKSKIKEKSAKTFIIGFLILCLSGGMFYLVWSNTNGFSISGREDVLELEKLIDRSIPDVGFDVSKDDINKNIGIDFFPFSHESAESIGKYPSEKPRGIFYIFELELANGSNEPKTIMPSDFYIIDSKGRRYFYSYDAQLRLYNEGEKESFFYETIQPGSNVVKYIVFDIPEYATGLNLVIRDGNSLFKSDKY